jgi:microcystin-dependent protein
MTQYVGEIRAVAFDFAPAGWAQCSGQLLSIAQHQALFNYLGTTFGGDGKTTFGLPDYRGRVPAGAGAGPGLQGIEQGEKGGSQSLTLAPQNLPSHSHRATALIAVFTGSKEASYPYNNVRAAVSSQDGSTRLPAYAPASEATGHLAVDATAVTVQPIGGVNRPVPLTNPFLGTNFIIALQGVHPNRA